MKFSATTILVGLCSVALAAPAPTRTTDSERGIPPFPRGWEWPEPSEAYPSNPFLDSSSESSQSSGFPFLPEGLEESFPGTILSELAEQLQSGEEEEGSFFPLSMEGEEGEETDFFPLGMASEEGETDYGDSEF
ncbi:uncharacterized protein BDV14DRAFT_194635 [Aspergillus stella-maris]|uniref:uncharacterized protein n=1 Tax=Aspergillus stella-maris TaxID=1810926 RepID=UPI003CCE1E1F